MTLPRRSAIDRLPPMIGGSLVIHIAFAAILNRNPWPTLIKVQPAAYTVTLMPVPIPEPEIPKTPIPPVPRETETQPIEKVKPIERVKPIEIPKKDDIIEKVKKPEKKIERLMEEKKESLKHLQEQLEEIRKKIALDEIQKRTARKEQTRKEQEEERLAAPLLTPPQVSSSTSSKSSPELLAIYSSIVRAKFLEARTIPENLLKEMVDLEATIVVIIDQDGRVQKPKFDKESGNAIYDQRTMRAIKKAEPFPPIPKELGENTLEFEMHFTPDLIR